MPGPDLGLLVEAARAAGEVALGYARRGYTVEDKGGGAGPVTEADFAVDTLLRDTLTAARPGHGWLSEETEDSADRLACDSVFVVDPIDGTRAFVDGGKDWSHSLAIVRNGVPVAAVVYLPRRDLLFAAEAGGGATLNGVPIRASGAGFDGASVLANRWTFEAKYWRRPPPVKRHFRSSLAYRLCLVAEGRFDAMATLRPTWHWDIAAGALIAAEAGATVTDRTGAPLRFNTPDPRSPGTLAGGTAVHAGLIGALA